MDFSDEQKETNVRERSDELASTYWNLQNNSNKVTTPKNGVYVIEKKKNEQNREAKEQIIRNLSVENSNAANADKVTVDHDPLKKARWRSLWLATLILFLVSVQFSIYFSSLWPYMDKICPNADETFFGFVVAGYSLGQMIASPVFAKWTNRIRQVRLPIAVAIVITLAGNFVYIFTEAFPANDRKWVLLGTRFVMGLSAGVVGVLRAYVATASKLEERHRAIAMATGAYSLGLTAGPIIQAALSPIGYPISGYPSGQIFFFNEYTAPAFVSMLASVILLVLLLLIFREHYEGVVAQKQQGSKNKSTVL